MKTYLKMIFYENGEASLTRLLAAVAFMAFLIGSGYLIFEGKTWGNYETFANLTAGGGAITQIMNKFINSRYNSKPGDPSVGYKTPGEGCENKEGE